jgi:hypothetical protein
MKVRSYINAQIEFVEDLPEEDLNFFRSNSNKTETKLKIAEKLKIQLNADNVLVKSYRFEEIN